MPITANPASQRHPTLRRQQKQETRERILDAASALITDGRGLDSLGLREVAREAGLAATSLYNHFADMDALGLALIDRACCRLRMTMAEGRRSMIEIGAAQALRELVARFVRFQNRHQDEFRLLLQQRLGRNDGYRRRIHDEVQLLVDELAEDIRQVVARLGRRPVPAAREAEAAVSVVFALGALLLDAPAVQRERLERHAREQLEIIALGGRCWAEGQRI